MTKADQDFLQTLPDLILLRLLGYLNYHDCLKLRLVSSKLKDLAESYTEPCNILKRLEKFPDSQQFFQEACSLNLKLSRLNISRTYNYEFRPLCHLTNLGASLKFLRLDNFNGGTVSSSQFEFLTHCTSLETLCIGTLDMTYPTVLQDDSKEFSKLGPILAGLKHFLVDKICFRYPSSLEMEYFEKLLKLSKNVEAIKVPLIIEKSRMEVDSDTFISVKYSFIAKPILKYVAKRGRTNNLHSLDMTNFETDFHTTFIKLVKVCNKTGTSLENVRYSLISKLISLKHDPQMLSVIKSFTRWNGDLLAIKHLKNVKKMSVDLELFRPQFQFPVKQQSQNNPKPEDIELTIRESNVLTLQKKGNIEEVAEVLLKNGKSFKHLILVESAGRQLFSTPIPFLSGIKHVNNLTVLKCIGFNRFSDNDFISILKNLRKLQELEIETYSSSAITDCGICALLNIDGKYENMGGCLKDLRKLKITVEGIKYDETNYNMVGDPINISTWSKLKTKLALKESPCSITDYSFSKIFRHLKLKSFLVQSPDIHITKLGYEYLLKGEFADTIEFFPVPKFFPTGLNAEEFHKFRRNFKHLKDNAGGHDDTFQMLKVSLAHVLQGFTS